MFYTYEWAMAAQSAYRSTLTPLLILGYEENELVGIASLATHAAQRKIVFLSASTADYCDFLTPPELRAEFIDAVFIELAKEKPTSIVMANLPADSQTLGALRSSAEKRGFHLFPAVSVSVCTGGVGRRRITAGIEKFVSGQEKAPAVSAQHGERRTGQAFAPSSVSRRDRIRFSGIR